MTVPVVAAHDARRVISEEFGISHQNSRHLTLLTCYVDERSLLCEPYYKELPFLPCRSRVPVVATGDSITIAMCGTTKRTTIDPLSTATTEETQITVEARIIGEVGIMVASGFAGNVGVTEPTGTQLKSRGARRLVLLSLLKSKLGIQACRCAIGTIVAGFQHL
jgi:hypothetical protein